MKAYYSFSIMTSPVNALINDIESKKTLLEIFYSRLILSDLYSIYMSIICGNQAGLQVGKWWYSTNKHAKQIIAKGNLLHFLWCLQ